jgi:hypothetical protein
VAKDRVHNFADFSEVSNIDLPEEALSSRKRQQKCDWLNELFLRQELLRV